MSLIKIFVLFLFIQWMPVGFKTTLDPIDFHCVDKKNCYTFKNESNLRWVNGRTSFLGNYPFKHLAIATNRPNIKTWGICDGSWVDIFKGVLLFVKAALVSPNACREMNSLNMSSRLCVSMPSTHSHFHSHTQIFLICWIHWWVYGAARPAENQEYNDLKH